MLNARAIKQIAFVAFAGLSMTFAAGCAVEQGAPGEHVGSEGEAATTSCKAAPLSITDPFQYDLIDLGCSNNVVLSVGITGTAGTSVVSCPSSTTSTFMCPATNQYVTGDVGMLVSCFKGVTPSKPTISTTAPHGCSIAQGGPEYVTYGWDDTAKPSCGTSCM
jgi:hypothetical protein